MKTRFIAVVHKWFVCSEGFEVHEIETDSRDRAEDKAARLYRKANRPFQSAAVKLIKLETGEHLPTPRPLGDKLTLRERLTGRLRRGHVIK